MLLKQIKNILLFLSITSFCFSEDIYEFKGQHFLASYVGCDHEALTDVELLTQAMEFAIERSGATVLDSCSYTFPGNGLTMVFLLSESHASIHTYPEHEACFVDLFTCGDTCTYEGFHTSLCSYLKPAHVNQKVLVRHEHIDEPYETIRNP